MSLCNTTRKPVETILATGLLSLFLVLDLAFLKTPWSDSLTPHLPHWAHFLGGMLTGIGFGVHGIYGFRGLRNVNLGQGLRRILFLSAFAGSIAFMFGTTTDFAGSFAKGWAAGAGAPFPSTVNTWQDLANWATFTALLTLLLQLLDKHRTEADRQRDLATEAQEALMRSRLAPHFIFNCLNTLKAQIPTDPAGAEATTDRLASLFRQAVQVSGLATHPLSAELAFVETYLGIEKARMGERLQVEIEVPEALEGCPILPLALQVLVENAVKHGVGPREEGGTIRISAARAGDVLTLKVEDPGTGVSDYSGTGTALATLRKRLARPTDLRYGITDGRHCATLRWQL